MKGTKESERARTGASDDAAIRDANNHLKGTEFCVTQRDGDSPVRRGIITIDNVKLRMAVFPVKVSKSGRAYHPVRLQYLPDQEYMLKAVRVGKEGVRA